MSESNGCNSLDRRLLDGFALHEACENEWIVPERHLGGDTDDLEVDYLREFMHVVMEDEL